MSLSGQILTARGWISGELRFDQHITRIQPLENAPKRYILPGFIDTHVHGGGGGDTMDGVEGIYTLARFHAQHGTTTLLPTTMTNPWDNVLAALAAVTEAMENPARGAADIVGAHLEGPFISPHRLGAQPAFAINPTPEKVEEVLDFQVIRVVTLAPELEGALEAAEMFAQEGIRVSMGHTTASYAQAEKLMEVGLIHGATHLYNAMGTLSGRDPSALGAILAHPNVYAELILDFHHVHKGGFLAAYRAKPDRLFLITDAMRAAGMSEGETELGGQKVWVKQGEARLANGTLAGSVLTLDVALQNAVRCGLTLPEVSRMLSKVPADYLGLSDRGELEVGLRADIVVLNEDLELEEVWIKGERIK